MNAQCPLRKYWVRTEGGDLQAQYKVRTSSSLWPLLFAAGLYQLGNIYGGCRRRFPNAKLGRNNLRVYLGADILNVAIRSPLSPLFQSVENSVIGGEVRLCECTPQWWVNYSGWRQHIAPIKVLFRGSSAYNCLLRTLVGHLHLMYKCFNPSSPEIIVFFSVRGVFHVYDISAWRNSSLYLDLHLQTLQ